MAFSSGAQNTTTTDDITSAGFGGFNLRGYSNPKPGTHKISATFSDATGTTSIESQFEVSDPFGWREPAMNVIIFLGDGMGAAHRTAARLVEFGVTGGDPNGYLAMDRCLGAPPVNPPVSAVAPPTPPRAPIEDAPLVHDDPADFDLPSARGDAPFLPDFSMQSLHVPGELGPIHERR